MNLMKEYGIGAVSSKRCMVEFRQDKMTEKERFEALLNRKPVDRVPLALIDNAFSGFSDHVAPGATNSNCFWVYPVP